MQGQNQIYLPKLSFINKILVIATSVVFILNLVLQSSMNLSLAPFLGVSAGHIMGGHLYSMLTYPFVSHSIIEVILNCLMLWLMGSEFEANWGRKRYTYFLFTVIFGGALFYLGISLLFFQSSLLYSYPLTGMSGLVASLCVAYAVIYPTRVFSFMMIIPIQAKYFCWILVAIALFQGISTPSMVGSWGQLGAIIAGFLFMVVVSHRNFKMLSEKIGQISQLSHRKKSKAKLSIVKDDGADKNERPPKYWQ